MVKKIVLEIVKRPTKILMKEPKMSIFHSMMHAISALLSDIREI